MGAAAYVGRVGGLAVALGVGSAVFTGHGVAWADGSESSASKSGTSATSDSDAKDSSEPAGTPDDETAEEAAEDEAASDEPEPEDEPDPEDEPELEDEPEPDEEAGEDADGEADLEPEGEDEDRSGTEEPQGAPAPEDAPEPDVEVRTPAKSKAKAATSVSAEVATDDTAEQAPQSAAESTDDAADDPGVPPRDPKKVAVFANATSLAESSPATLSPTVAALLTTRQDQAAAAEKPSLVTAVVNVVKSMFDWARQKADANPGDAPQPPFLWALLSFARRELDNLFAARTTGTARNAVATVPTSLALAEEATTAAALVPSYSPWFNPQVSPSTNFVSWVTGRYVYGLSEEQWKLANTYNRFGVWGTDVGVMWDNGMVDDPATPWNEHQVLIAVGDTFSNAAMTAGWRYNTLFRSSDWDLSDGVTIENGEWFNGNMFGGAPLGFAPDGYEDSKWARPIINRPAWAPNSVTLIPTAGVSLPTEVTEDTPYGTIQYVSFMSVSEWGQAGRWSTNYSAIAYSTDNGENFKVAPESVRYNSFLSGNRNFQQSAFVKGDDGYVYVYGTPNGRQGAAYVARVTAEDILDVSQYEYYKAASSGWFGSSQARWVKGSPSSASAVIGKSGGACGFTKPGYSVSEMSVQYNEYLQKYVVLYGDQNNSIVMRTSDTPEGTWSDATVLMNQQTGGIYAPMLHPWSPSTQGTGSDLYWNLSLWSDYNIMLMRTDLTKL